MAKRPKLGDADLSPYSLGWAMDELCPDYMEAEKASWTLTVSSQNVPVALLCAMGYHRVSVELSTEYDCDTWKLECARLLRDDVTSEWKWTRKELVNPGA